MTGRGGPVKCFFEVVSQALVSHSYTSLGNLACM